MNPPKPHLAYESSVCRNTIKILLPVKNPTESHLRGAKDDLVVLNWLRRTIWYFVPRTVPTVRGTYVTSPISSSKLPYWLTVKFGLSPLGKIERFFWNFIYREVNINSCDGKFCLTLNEENAYQVKILLRRFENCSVNNTLTFSYSIVFTFMCGQAN